MIHFIFICVPYWLMKNNITYTDRHTQTQMNEVMNISNEMNQDHIKKEGKKTLYFSVTVVSFHKIFCSTSSVFPASLSPVSYNIFNPHSIFSYTPFIFGIHTTEYRKNRVFFFII